MSSFVPVNKLIIITAPSGAGKTSITQHLLECFPRLEFSVSASTRAPRDGEIHGRDYYFMSEAEFQKRIQQGEFVEWEMVYEGKYYGTLKAELERIWNTNKIPILDIDVKGAIHVQQQYPQSTFSLFILPPSIEELKRRLLTRGTETSESLQARISKASYEISFKHSFSKTILNSDLDRARDDAKKLVQEFLQAIGFL